MFSSIMVSCDRTEKGRNRVRLASGLARSLDARLFGVAARPLEIPVYTAGAPLVSYADIEQYAMAEVDEVRRGFEEHAGHSNKIEWRQSSQDPVRYLALQGRAADLIVVGRRAEGDPFDTQMGVDPGAIVLEAGRPVLVVPPDVHELKPDMIAIAWRDSREARRAVRDAIPLLRMAEEIHVIEITLSPLAPVAACDVVDWLAGRGITAHAHAFEAEALGEAATFLDRAAHLKADLLVTGGYGRSRLREFMFGGFTRELLHSTDRCCLMSN